MNWGRFNILDVSNEEHIKLFKYLEDKIGDDSPRFIDELKKLNPLEVKTILFSKKDSSIDNMCYIHGYNDLKDCDIYFDKYDLNDLDLIDISYQYASIELNMINIRVHIPNDKKVISRLEKNGFDYIGDIDGEETVVLLKDLSNELELTKNNSKRM